MHYEKRLEHRNADPENPADTISDFDFDFNVEKWRALPFVILAAIAAYIYLT